MMCRVHLKIVRLIQRKGREHYGDGAYTNDNFDEGQRKIDGSFKRSTDTAGALY